MIDVNFIDLPLHDGFVPKWLFERMVRLSRLILRLLIDEYGEDRVVEFFSNPIFFQAFNNLIGMDWDSSGSTTVTTAVLKRALEEERLGIRVAWVKGKAALNTPEELKRISQEFDLDYDVLLKASRLTAKIDSTAFQDGYRLYHHAIIVSKGGSWAVIQQGMNVERKMARRYHIYHKNDLLNEPHTGVVGVKEERALNLVCRFSENARKAILDLVKQDPRKVMRDWAYVRAILKGNRPILPNVECPEPQKVEDIKRRLKGLEASLEVEVLEKARDVLTFEGLLLVRGLGPKAMLALALIAELIYGIPVSWNDVDTIDPRKFAFAMGGKDGSPYPIRRDVYDVTIEVLQRVVELARKDNSYRIFLKRLAEVGRRLDLPLDLVRPTPP